MPTLQPCLSHICLLSLPSVLVRATHSLSTATGFTALSWAPPSCDPTLNSPCPLSYSLSHGYLSSPSAQAQPRESHQYLPLPKQTNEGSHSQHIYWFQMLRSYHSNIQRRGDYVIPACCGQNEMWRSPPFQWLSFIRREQSLTVPGRVTTLLLILSHGTSPNTLVR